jgi:hypothetical protein
MGVVLAGVGGGEDSRGGHITGEKKRNRTKRESLFLCNEWRW